MLKCPLPAEITLIFVGSDIPSNRVPETRVFRMIPSHQQMSSTFFRYKPIAPYRQIECIIYPGDNIEITGYIASLGIQGYRCATHEYGTKPSHHLIFVEHFAERCDNLPKGLW
jgi:hypothetical protein